MRCYCAEVVLVYCRWDWFLCLCWFCSLLLLRLWGRLLLLFLWVLIRWNQSWRVSLRLLNKIVSVRLLLLICNIVHRPSIAAISCITNYRDGGSAAEARAGAGSDWLSHRRGIAIEDKVGNFEAEELAYLEMEATSSAGTCVHLLLLLLRSWLLWLLLLLLLLSLLSRA